MDLKKQVNIEDFFKLDIRLGTIITAEDFPEARKPAYKLSIDFGSLLGIKKSSAQITRKYQIDQLIGKQVLAIVNLPPMQIGSMQSDVLILGIQDNNGNVILITSDMKAPNGALLF